MKNNIKSITSPAREIKKNKWKSKFFYVGVILVLIIIGGVCDKLFK